jgi:Ca2+-binding EF-hand superfamily protein
MDHSTRLKEGVVDKFELFEQIGNAIEMQNLTGFTKEQFVQAVESYFRMGHHEWNNTFEAEVEQFFDHLDKNNDTVLSTKEIFNEIFTWFDQNGDQRLNDTEIKQMYEFYAKFLNR